MIKKAVILLALLSTGFFILYSVVDTKGNRDSTEEPKRSNPRETAGPGIQLPIDDGSTVDDGYLAICCNTSPYTYLGNRQLTVAPDADLDHGLALVTVRTLGLTTILGLAASALGSGRWIRSSRQVDYRSDLSGFTIGGHGPVPYQVDGDYLGDSESLVFRHRPAVLRLVTPPAGSGRAPDALGPGGS